ncbi:LLM class flavin-dependent oxidoreductase [Actinokineospora enzanensis]|uniref:LLM class flavin-dependent oxidoreductase n=1 Tax=Actinokineospora enzanensis TaxID=155975 RepID=UPI00035D4996|nr:LLM class flavin-dependent oxidoreductase [Actinokineospora enzanensis]
MRIGLGLPNGIPGASADDLLNWAVEGDRAGFSTLASLDRLVYDNHESLTTLAAVAAVTERARLMTAILIAPLHTNTALLAKQTATIDQLSGGRLTLGLAVGARPDDFRAAGAEHAGRGPRFDTQLTELRYLWSGQRRGFAGGVGPRPVQPTGPRLILGGHAPGAVHRAATRAEGWISGSGGLTMFRHGADAVRTAWHEANRQGRPDLHALCYFSLGDKAEEQANSYLRHYYGFAPPYADAVVKGTAIGGDAVRKAVQDYADAGCDELILVPCAPELDQLKQLRAALPDTLPL